MGYRGEDLDLRTPQTWSATAADLAGGGDLRGRPGAYGLNRNGPILVDEIVLACCNHAYDVALLNRAGEVRLEHMLHALTRIDAAAEALEARGVRVAALRRDTATVIASEIPIGMPNGKGTPRRSESFEEVLRLAAAHASRRNSPAGVDDVLHIIMDVEPGLPGLALIARNMARPASFNEPPLRTAYEPRAAEFQEPVRPRMPAGTYYVNEPARAPRSEFYGSATDNVQNTRLDALEQMVRALGNDLAGERKGFSNLLQDIQREVSAQREDAGRLGGGLHERLQGVDSIIERRLGEFSRPWLQMNDRLQGLEHAMLNVRPSAATDLGPIGERLATLESAVQSSLAESTRQAQSLVDKVKSLETALAARPAVIDGKIDLAPLSHRLDMIEEAVLSREAATREISDRLRGQEDVLAADRATVRESHNKLLSELKTMAGLIDRESDETAAAVLDSLTARLEGLAGVIEGRHSETAQALASNAATIAQLIERLASTEIASREYTKRVAELQQNYAQELTEVHDALMKLNTNQHTLAGSIDHWRQDTASTMSIIGSRMETVERESAKPVALLESMGQTMDRMHKVTVERYYRRNRFWYWLFGADDWIASSWPAQASRIADDARLAKPASAPKR